MKISVISAWGAVEPFAPFFHRHYHFADEIRVLCGPGPWEGESFPGIEIKEVSYPGGQFCEYRKRDALNGEIRDIEADWILCVDADEFVFPMGKDGPTADVRPFLEDIQDGNLVYADLWDVFRNYSDRDLDPSEPPLFQRRHGNPEVHFLFQKPIVFRPESGIRFHSGQHRYFQNDKVKVSKRCLHGVHWKYADVGIAVERQKIRDQLTADLQKQPFVNVQAICQKHMLDPQLY